MNKQDLYLSDEQISTCYDIPENDKYIATTKDWTTARKAVDVKIAQAASDHTLKKIVEEGKKFIALNEHAQIEAVWAYWQALKKLAEKK